LADLEEVEEDGGIDGVWAREEVVVVRKGGEDFGRELKPGTMEGGDVTPVSRVS
jgi:hypothetical protein